MNGFGFSEKESEYLESVNREYDKRLSPYACKNNAAIYCKRQKKIRRSVRRSIAMPT